MPTGPLGVIFRVAEDTVANGVDFVFRRFIKWNDPVVSENTDGGRTAVPRDGAIIQAISEQTIDALTEADLTIQGVRGDTSTYGEQTLTYTVPGMLWLTTDDGATLLALPDGLEGYVEAAGNVIIDRRGWGAIEGEIEVLDTVAGEPGDYIDLEAPHQVNAKVSQSPITQRGGTRKVQIIGRTAKPGTAVLHLEDAGNLAQTLPTPPDPPDEAAIPVPTFTLAASVDEPETVATATVTNDTDLEEYGVDGVEWQYAVQETEPTEDGTPFGPLALGFGVDTIDTPAVPSGSTVWVRARSAVAATGERSDWSAWQSITLGPTLNDPDITLSLSYTIDSAGVVDVLASTNGTSVKFALAAEGVSEATDTDIRAATADATAPFEALDIVTLAEGATRHVSAFAYDDLLNESVKVTIPVTRGVDDGNAEGTPGNLVLTMHAGPAAVAYEVGAALTEPEVAQNARIHLNTAKARSAFMELGNHAAASAGTEVHFVYTDTANPGPTDWLEAGPKVPVSVVGFPVPSTVGALVAGAIGTNKLFGWATKGGDGATTVKVSNIYVRLFSADPETVPEPPDPPTSDIGSPILDLNAFTLRDIVGLADNAPVTAWPDDTGHQGPSGPWTSGGGQSAALFKTTGFPGGLPSVRVSGTNDGFYVTPPTLDECTFYFVVANVTGSGTQSTSGTAAPMAITNGAGGSNFWLAVRGDGTIQAAVNTSVFGNTRAVGTADVSGATPHIIRLAWDRDIERYRVYVDGVQDITLDHEVLAGSWILVSQIFFGNTSAYGNKLDCDYGRILCYAGSEFTTGLNAVELVLQAQWGTP